MIIELLVNLKTDNGVIKAGTYDSSKREFPSALSREIEIHKERGRRTLRIIKEDAPSPSVSSKSKKTSNSSRKKKDDTNTMDDASTFTTTEQETSEDESQTKKPRRKKT